MRILIFLLFLLPLSLIGQVESQFNGTLNVFSASRIGFTNTFTISGIFQNTTSHYTSANSATGDIVQVQSGTRFYHMHIYSIASNSGGVITCNVRDSSSTLTTFPTGKWSIFRPTTNLRLPLSPDGETNASRSATFNTLALKVDDIQQQVSSSTNCERTITKTAHGFSKWTPVYWTGANYVRPPYDSLVPDYIVVDSLTANTFKVATCGTYATVLPNGLYWYTNQSPGYSLTQDTTKAPLFQVIDSTLILDPIVGFNLMSEGGGALTGVVRAIPYHNSNGRYTTNTNFRLDTTTSAGALGKYYLKLNAGSNTISAADSYNVLEAWSGDAVTGGAVFTVGDQTTAYITAGYGSRIIQYRYGTSLTAATNITTGSDLGLFGFGGWVNGNRNNFLGSISGTYTGTGFTARSSISGNSATSSGIVSGWRLDSLSRFWLGSGADDYYFPTTMTQTNNLKYIPVFTSNGTNAAGSMVAVQNGVATGTTDGSGDLTVTFAAAMPDATYSLIATVEGTTSYTISVHTKATGTCKVRFFNPATGAAVTATSVTISYEAKDY